MAKAKKKIKAEKPVAEPKKRGRKRKYATPEELHEAQKLQKRIWHRNNIGKNSERISKLEKRVGATEKSVEKIEAELHNAKWKIYLDGISPTTKEAK